MLLQAKSSKRQVQTLVDYEWRDLLPEDEPVADGEEERRFPSPRLNLEEELLGQANARWAPKHEEQRCAYRKVAKGDVQRPLFHEIQTTKLPDEPEGSQSAECVAVDEREEEPAAWKLNN